MATISERLKEALALRDMKQSELVRLTGIGKSSISTYLSGEYEPKQKNIYKIAKALSVSEAWLMGYDVPINSEPGNANSDSFFSEERRYTIAFGRNLRFYREQSGISQSDLADYVGVSKSTISMYEHGNREPSYQILSLLSEVLKISKEALLSSEIDMHYDVDYILPNADKLPNRIKELRISKNLSMAECARALDIPYTTYINYEKNEREPNAKMYIKLSQFFGVSVDYLIGNDGQQSAYSFNYFPNVLFIPVISTEIKTGNIFSAENITSFICADKQQSVDFALRCVGDSMINARIFNGDIVFIRQQPDVDDGDIAAVLIGNEATLKKVNKFPGKLVLSPCNPLYNDLIYTGEQLDAVRILGKAVAFISAVR